MTGGELPKGWTLLSDERSRYFSEEFYREADKSHPLFDERMWAIARCDAADEFLFKIHDGRFAVIHLTWAVETTPDFPGFGLYDTLDEWRADVSAHSLGDEA